MSPEPVSPEPVSPDKSELLALAADVARRYVAGERAGRASPDAAAVAALDGFPPDALDHPIPAAEAVALLDRLGGPAAMRTTGGRYFGFVNGGVDPAGLAASVVAGAWDQNLALPVMSPVGAHLDATAARWIVDLLGLPAGALASFCAGATVANLTAVVTARDTLLGRAGWDVRSRGLAGAPPLAVVTSAEIHASVGKALAVAGLGLDTVTAVPTDASGRLDPAAFAAVVGPDAGPTLVIVQAGNVNTGHSDPFAAVADHLESTGVRNRCWIHVDGAFGLWAAAAPARRHLVAGVDRADSWATDAHKWLNAPYDCGVVAVADPGTLRAAMSMDAAYVSGAGDDRPLMNLGIQMSQAARAVPVWAILATWGRAGVAEAVERCCGLADRFARRLADAGVEILAPVVLNQALAAFPGAESTDAGTCDETTDAVIAAVQADGAAWLGATTWQGRRAMRISVSDTSTTGADVDTAADAVLRAWAGVRQRG
ncbi:MAG: pyridoxal-dependent decarboxylase [Acidimicrobiales bacterium]